MAQLFCAVIKRCPKGKGNGFGCAITLSLTAQLGPSAQISLSSLALDAALVHTS
jgi:hypothetical protein